MDTEQIERAASVFEWLSGMTLAQVEAGVIRASFARHTGHRRRMMSELGIGKTTLLRKLDALGLRKRRSYLVGRP
jgi:DNA-binding NtrC family response regulator